MSDKNRIKGIFGDEFATAGDKVRFLNKNGHEYQPRYAREAGLVEGELYTVAKEDVGRTLSTYELVEFPGKHFNTVMFDEVFES
jgi:hypothetical protein